MSTFVTTPDGEVPGTSLFTMAAIVGAVVLLLATFWADAPLTSTAVQQASNPQVEQVVVTATHTGHTS